MKKVLILSVSILSLFACTTKPETSPIQKIESAHQKDAFYQEEAITFHLNLSFHGKQRLDAQVSTTTNSNKGIIEYSNGEVIAFSHDTVFCTQKLSENESKTRFDAYTWSYFFLFPYKLSDPGTVWSETTVDTIKQRTFNRQKLTFKNAVGDTPDDWYIVFSNPENHLIEYSSYIVTANKTLEEAEADPHAIQYLDYKNIGNIPFAQKWLFLEWRENEGFKKQLGQGEVQNIRFISADSIDQKINQYELQIL